MSCWSLHCCLNWRDVEWKLENKKQDKKTPFVVIRISLWYLELEGTMSSLKTDRLSVNCSCKTEVSLLFFFTLGVQKACWMYTIALFSFRMVNFGPRCWCKNISIYRYIFPHCHWLYTQKWWFWPLFNNFLTHLFIKIYSFIDQWNSIGLFLLLLCSLTPWVWLYETVALIYSFIFVILSTCRLWKISKQVLRPWSPRDKGRSKLR